MKNIERTVVIKDENSSVAHALWMPLSNKSFSLIININSNEIDDITDLILIKSKLRNALNASIKNNTLFFDLFTDCDEQPFTIFAPITDGEYLLTYNGYNFKLFINGVLYDEEWPFGDIPNEEFSIIYADTAYVSSLYISNESPSESVVGSIYKPSQEMKDKVLGKPPTRMQYFQPLGNQAFAGDCIPFFHNGVFHLYYLFDRRHHRSKKGYGAHQWAHASTINLKDWTHHPIALGITDETEGSICTGSVIEKDGIYYAFYAKRDTVEKREKVTYAIGKTPDFFEKTNKFVYDFPSPPYIKGPGRDPFVYKGEDGKYYMLVTTRIEGFENKGGCLARLVSDDLENWFELKPYIPGYSDDPECADYFKMNGWYYIIFSNEGVAKYRMSRSPNGPWLSPNVDIFDVPAYRVMKTAAFHGNRRIGVAFLEKTYGEFGGNIIFREIIQNADGTLSTCVVPELETKSEPNIIPKYQYNENTKADTESCSINFPEGLTFVKVSDIPQNFQLKANIKTSGRFFGIAVRSTNEYADGNEIRFDLSQKTIQLKKASDSYSTNNLKYTLNCADIPLDDFSLTLCVYGDIVDACINGQRSMCGRISDKEAKNLYFYAHSAKVTLENVKVNEFIL